MKMPWEETPRTDDYELPAALRRDTNNVAPFMLSPAANPPVSRPAPWVQPWEAKS